MNQAYRQELRTPGLGVYSELYEIQVNILRTKLGSSAPTASNRAVGASGSILVPVYSFSNVTEQEVYFEWHVPFNTDVNKAIAFHIMWQPAATWTTGNYMWKLEYLVKDENATLLAGTPTTISADVTPSNATTEIETEFASTISVTSTEQTIQGRLYRDVANDNGDAAGELRFLEFAPYLFPGNRRLHPRERIGY